MLWSADGRGYGYYKKLFTGKSIDYGLFSLRVTRVQSDPYAPPSWIEIHVPWRGHRYPREFIRGRGRRAFLDYLYRILYSATHRYPGKCGSGYSCVISVPKPGPWILYRSGVDLDGDALVVRFKLGLPARGRRIVSRKAIELFLEKVPSIVREVMDSRRHVEGIARAVELYIDQEYLREWLIENNYVSFIADGSILPRESSISQKPLKGAKPFRSPGSLRVKVTLPSGRVLTGMPIPRGITVITGGGYHGKTTLLKSVLEGVYNHVRGDGREYVVSTKNIAYIEAEDGRIISCVDISSIINDLPSNTDTLCFSTLNASGSTSMAASLSEAIELGVEAILFDEDTSATNLLYKDNIMRKLISREPITPLSDIGREIFLQTNTSIVGIISASSAFLEVADKVLLMEEYMPRDISLEARRHVGRIQDNKNKFRNPRARVFLGVKGLMKIMCRGKILAVKYSDKTKYTIDLSANPRIVETGQARFIAKLVSWANRRCKGLEATKIAVRVDELFSKRGFKGFMSIVPPDLAEASGLDLVWTLNRLYNVLFKHK